MVWVEIGDFGLVRRVLAGLSLVCGRDGELFFVFLIFPLAIALVSRKEWSGRK